MANVHFAQQSWAAETASSVDKLLVVCGLQRQEACGQVPRAFGASIGGVAAKGSDSAREVRVNPK